MFYVMDTSLLAEAPKYMLLLYNWLIEFIEGMLAATVFRGNPSMAMEYAKAFSLLTSITAIYIILTIFEGLKRFIRAILILGWVLLMVTIAIQCLVGKA